MEPWGARSALAGIGVAVVVLKYCQDGLELNWNQLALMPEKCVGGGGGSFQDSLKCISRII